MDEFPEPATDSSMLNLLLDLVLEEKISTRFNIVTARMHI